MIKLNELKLVNKNNLKSIRVVKYENDSKWTQFPFYKKNELSSVQLNYAKFMEVKYKGIQFHESKEKNAVFFTCGINGEEGKKQMISAIDDFNMFIKKGIRRNEMKITEDIKKKFKKKIDSIVEKTIKEVLTIGEVMLNPEIIKGTANFIHPTSETSYMVKKIEFNGLKDLIKKTGTMDISSYFDFDAYSDMNDFYKLIQDSATTGDLYVYLEPNFEHEPNKSHLYFASSKVNAAKNIKDIKNQYSVHNDEENWQHHSSMGSSGLTQRNF